VFDVVVVGGIFAEILDGDTAPRSRYWRSALIAAILASGLGASTSIASYVGEEDAEAIEAMLKAARVDVGQPCSMFQEPADVRNSQKGDRPWPMLSARKAVPRLHSRFQTPNCNFGIRNSRIDPVRSDGSPTILRGAQLVWDGKVGCRGEKCVCAAVCRP